MGIGGEMFFFFFEGGVVMQLMWTISEVSIPMNEAPEPDS